MVHTVSGRIRNHHTAVLWWKDSMQSSGVKWNGFESAFLGKSKEFLDKIELSLSLDSAIHLFGPFLRYYTCDRLQQLPPMRNAFTVLMSSQRQLSLPGLPAPVTVRTKKDTLYNDFLELLKDKNALFSGIEVNSSGKKLCEDSGWMFMVCGWTPWKVKEAICSYSWLLREIHRIQSSTTFKAQKETKH